MAYGDRSYVRNERGETTHVDIDNGTGQTHRYETFCEGDKTAKELVAVQNHETGHFRETAGTDWFGNPIYKD